MHCRIRSILTESDTSGIEGRAFETAAANQALNKGGSRSCSSQGDRSHDTGLKAGTRCPLLSKADTETSNHAD